MSKRRISGIILWALLLAPLGLTQETVDIRVWLFKGILRAGEPTPEKVEIMSPVSNPGLSPLKSLIGRSKDDFKAGLIDTLAEAKTWQTLDDLWPYKKTWEKTRPNLGSAIIKNKLSFRIDLYRIHLSPVQLAFRVVISKSREGAASDGRSAKFWVEKETFQLIRSEFLGVPIEGYEDVLTDSTALNTMPEFLTIHEYKTEKNGVLDPERTSIKVEYPRPRRNILKYKSEMTYGKFKFFSVETQPAIIK